MTKQKSIKEIKGALFLISTPIGNLGDISARAIETIKNSDLIFAEDTRVTKKLLSAFGISKPVWRADEEKISEITPKCVEMLREGKNIGFVSDAGTPCVSDPGQRLAKEVIDAGFEIFAIPGASSVLTALVISGFESAKFAFMGFAPNKAKARDTFFQECLSLGITIVFFETGPRLLASLEALAKIAPNHNLMVAREMTKLYEEKIRGKVSEVFEHYTQKGAPKGEIVIVLEGMKPETETSQNDIESELTEALKTNSSKDAAKIIAQKFDRPRHEIYEMALSIKGK